MNKVGIATDSHSGILREEAERLEIMVLPMPFFIDEVCYYEEVSITREELFAAQKEEKKVSTSQPSPEAVMEFWRQCGKNCKTDSAKSTKTVKYILWLHPVQTKKQRRDGLQK